MWNLIKYLEKLQVNRDIIKLVAMYYSLYKILFSENNVIYVFSLEK